MTYRRYLLLVMAAALLLSFVNCTKENKQITGDIFDEANIPASEKLIIKAVEDRDPSRILTLTDSLEKTGDISAVTANYYRGKATNIDYDPKMAKKYLGEVVANRNPSAADLRPYLKASATLAGILVGEGKYEEALTEAVPTLAKMDSLGFDKSLNDVVLLTIAIGISQQNLHQTKEAAATFDKTYQMLQKWMEVDTTSKDFRSIFAFFDGITTSYFSTSQYDKVMVWLNREDSVLAVYSSRPNVSPERMDEFRGILSLDQAEASQQLGLTDEAARYYQQFQKSEFSKSDHSRINAVNYLYLAGRYQEAADNYEVLDSWMEQWGFDLSLDNIGLLLLPKMRANVLAGRKDSAINVLMKIAECYDSALTHQKRDVAVELATIYDTKGKETMIARQDARISRGRIFILIASIIMLTVFFIIFNNIRYRAAKRLAKVKAAQERIENELHIAREIQMSMVPDKFPNYPGLDMFASMTPAREVGGDLYSFVLKEDRDELYFCIGDVSGKGVPSSLFMSQTTRLFNIMAENGMSPSKICTYINKALSGEDNVNGMFVTLFIGLLDLKTGHLTFCNAGHNPPVLGGGKNAGDFLEMESNAPIGLWPGLEYKEEEIGSIKGRPLFVYTDGLNEAENAQQEQFGDDRLLKFLRSCHYESSQQVIDTITNDVERFREGAEPNDDLTMLCLTII